ncbi:MAG: DNA/RNA non-specific endonuclease [Lachnospiraceae bacterium]|nr:DNA/RNA non-specific endonuclease [Lachnospiraceae bacterium]
MKDLLKRIPYGLMAFVLSVSVLLGGCSDPETAEMMKEAGREVGREVGRYVVSELQSAAEEQNGKRPGGTSGSGTSGGAVTLDGSGQFSLSEIPEYSGEPFAVVNDNVPFFAESDLTTESFEHYSELDELGRCGAAYANVGRDLMPTEKRGEIGHVKPTGWQSVQYDFVDGKSLYNRCHLLGFQLTGENANWENLITGTRYLNVDGMLPFENMVADYVKETGNHVLYRVTPIFEEDNLVASGVEMEAMSVEDHGDGVLFHVYAYNVQPGVVIDYATGDNRLSEEFSASADEGAEEIEIRGNSRSKVYHCPGQAAYEDMKNSGNLVIFHSEKEAKAAGYRKAQR